MCDSVHTNKCNRLGKEKLEYLCMVKVNTKEMFRSHADFSNNISRNSNTMGYFYSNIFSANGVVEK